MVLVDTCGWIEWLTDGWLADRFAPWLRAQDEVLVPTLVQFELYKWVKRERGERAALEAVALTEQCEVVPMTTPIALLAGDIALAHGLALADALIYATARQHEAELITADDHFSALPGVTFFPKLRVQEL